MEKLGRRGFLGLAIGTVVASQLPFIAKAPAVPLLPPAPAPRGRLRTYIYVNDELLEGPELRNARIESIPDGAKLSWDLEEISLTKEAHVGPLILAEAKTGIEVMRYSDVDFYMHPGDTLRVSPCITINTWGSVTRNMAVLNAEFLKHLLEGFS